MRACAWTKENASAKYNTIVSSASTTSRSLFLHTHHVRVAARAHRQVRDAVPVQVPNVGDGAAKLVAHRERGLWCAVYRLMDEGMYTLIQFDTPHASALLTLYVGLPNCGFPK